MYKSLYEYFGKAVGGETGKQVYKASKRDRIRVQVKEISNPRYRGKVMTYPVSWLDTYFTLKTTDLPITQAHNINPCAELHLPEKKKQTLNFY